MFARVLMTVLERNTWYTRTSRSLLQFMEFGFHISCPLRMLRPFLESPFTWPALALFLYLVHGADTVLNRFAGWILLRKLLDPSLTEWIQTVINQLTRSRERDSLLP